MPVFPSLVVINATLAFNGLILEVIFGDDPLVIMVQAVVKLS